MSKSYDLWVFDGKKEKNIDINLLFVEAMGIMTEKVNNKEADLSNEIFILKEFNDSNSGNINNVICFGEINNILYYAHA